MISRAASELVCGICHSKSLSSMRAQVLLDPDRIFFSLEGCEVFLIARKWKIRREL